MPAAALLHGHVLLTDPNPLANFPAKRYDPPLA